mmetsp:Transcript_6080/g.5997  ORF Transcript_6080/g.5997 Transcript_6080/m.5997 type:complete len:144 (+) Transcript_6080:702-1133(+)
MSISRNLRIRIWFVSLSVSVSLCLCLYRCFFLYRYFFLCLCLCLTVSIYLFLSLSIMCLSLSSDVAHKDKHQGLIESDPQSQKTNLVRIVEEALQESDPRKTASVVPEYGPPSPDELKPMNIKNRQELFLKMQDKKRHRSTFA